LDCIRHWLAAALLAGSATLAVAPASAQQQSVPAVEEIAGEFADGTAWLVETPINWNGVLVLDLDAAFALRMPPGAPPRPPSPFKNWLFEQGVAVGGITREPIGYDFPQAVTYLLEVRDDAIARWGQPRLTIAAGGSRGAFVVRKALELHPDIFDGGFMTAGGGAGEIAVLNNKLNALFVLKTLVDPDSPIELVNVRDVPGSGAALQALVERANSTQAGRARLALAAAVQQFAPWTSREAPKPSPSDAEAIVDQIAASFVFATALPVRAGVEKIAGGNVSWNTGTDYENLLQISGRRAVVEQLYAAAGISLADDLATLAAAPRIAADPAAVRRAEPLMTYSGAIADPLVNLDNDDPVDPASDKYAYLNTLKRAGTAGFLRIVWSDLPGHGGQTDLDRAVGFTMLMERIENGAWGDFSVEALRARAADIASQSPSVGGESRIFDPGTLPPPASEWDGSDWGTYRP
jgi:hypothetical protein